MAWAEKFPTEVNSGAALKVLKQYVPQIKGQPPTAQQFGCWLGDRKGRYYGEYKLVGRHDAHKKQTFWRVEKYQKAKGPGVA